MSQIMRGFEPSKHKRAGVAILAAAAMVLGVTCAQAAEKPKQPTSIWQQDTLTGDWGGTRTTLKDKGIEFTLVYIGETFAVLSGGIDRRASYEGRFEFTVDTSLEKLIGWTGASTHFSIYQLHNSGHNVADNVGSVADSSYIDGLPTTRLFTAWFEQSFNDRFSLRIGQLAADDEFMISPTVGGIVNGTEKPSYGGLLNGIFGWAGILGPDMVNGGPAFPLAAPGVRLKVNATDSVTLLAAVFSGDPAGRNCTGNPEECNKYGTTFSFSGGALWMGELQYKLAGYLPGVYKIGAWHATADYADQHFGVNGAGNVVSLADPAAAGPLNHSGNWGTYGLVDQMVSHIGKDGSVNVFLRGGVAPTDRNLISFYMDGGIGVKGALRDRPNDVFTLGIAYSKISPDAAALDRDTLAIAPSYPIRDEEVVFEMTYAAQIAPWWIVQPDLQYIIHPGGNVPNPNDPTVAIGNAFIAGIRSTIKF
jgi:porin